MFNKTNKPVSPAAPAKPVNAPPPLDIVPANAVRKPMAAGPRTGASSVGTGLLVDGNVTGTGDLHIDGTVRGDVKCSHLTVGESGNIEGKVEAETIEVRGRVLGAIAGKQVKLQATAYVEGDITHEQLAIDVGAYFQGRCLQTRRAEAPAATAAAPASAAAPLGDYGAPSLGSYDMSAISDLK